MEPVSELEVALRLLLATVLGALIGLERERKNQAAGFRTHTILCVGSALVMILSMKVAGARYDPGRIAAQVVSGIGFLGAGAILRMGASVKGLTTAATVWTVAAIGLAVGYGLYSEAVIVASILFLALYFFNLVEKRFFSGKQGHHSLCLSALDAPGVIAQVSAVLESHRIQVSSISINRNPLEGKVEIFSSLVVPPDVSLQGVVTELQSIPGSQEIEMR